MPTTDLASPEKSQIREFFNSIAKDYDYLNTFLSFRLDAIWRKRSIKLLLESSQETILDIGTGTGKFLGLFLGKKKWNRAVGLDFASEMLVRARVELAAEAEFVSADFHDLPFQEKQFDLIISSFTLRSVKNMRQFLSEVYRLLAQNGKVGFLCLTRPKSILSKILYYPYLNFYLPLAGKMLSGHKEAYSFLSQSIQQFQDTDVTMSMMAEIGFREIREHPFTLGAATLIEGRK